ncbi:hypothetical protein BP5796_10503 [Coleophoma crateriformis]|uniref:Uncharacterized protein n=1 Tax=Coleophoma crateriformis TaxID=565419 RepID=A0A3D8QQL8_9HELO|nr:hypothetical protein BP5796_10503 [Coleophoma crateriformis]
MDNTDSHEMSGALPPSDFRRSTNTAPSQDQNVPIEAESTSQPQEPRHNRPIRRESFFVIPDGSEPGKPLRRIEVKPKQKASAVRILRPKRKRYNAGDRSSLDAILRHATNGPNLVDPERHIPLPESRPETSATNSGGSQHELEDIEEPKSSLEAILRHAGVYDHTDFQPASIPLPESPAASIQDISRPQVAENSEDVQMSLQELQRQRQYRDGHRNDIPEELLQTNFPPAPLQWVNYTHIIDSAAGIFPHLVKVSSKNARHPAKMDITYIDFFENSRSEPTVCGTGGPDALNYSRSFDVLRDIPIGCKQRLIVVEDLSPTTIELLGSLYGPNPEFFESHLLNSGYDGPNYDDQPAHEWPTSRMKRSYSCIKWHRPVRRLDMVPYSKQDLDDLLNPDYDRLEYDSSDSNDLLIYRTETNIFRSEWEMWTDPVRISPSSFNSSVSKYMPQDVTIRNERVCGWEERASIWSQKLEHKNLILLLDPLPDLGEGMERVVEVGRLYRADSDGHSTALSDGTIHNVESPTNDEVHLNRLAQHRQSRHNKVGTNPPTRLGRILQRFRRKEVSDDSSEISQTLEVMRVKDFTPLFTRRIFEQLAPRAQLDIDFDAALRSPQLMTELQTKVDQLRNTRSTRDEFCARLASVPYTSKDNGHFGMIIPLYQVIHSDAITLLEQLQRTLDEINIDILDDMRMEDRLALWRRLITRAQFELPNLKQSIESFFSFLDLLNPAVSSMSSEDDGSTRSIRKELVDLSQRIDDMLGKLQTTSSSLTSNMALLDSRRSIAEAQAVTKLTELAFFFIPLSFAATLFGMQVKPLGGPASLSIFFALGICFTASAYIIRLVLRSEWLRGLRQAYWQDIRGYAEKNYRPLQRQHVPASLFLQWSAHTFIRFSEGQKVALWAMGTKVWVEVGFIIQATLLVLTIAVAPVVVLWTRHMNHGTQAAITVIIILIVSGVTLPILWANSDADFRMKPFKVLNSGKALDSILDDSSWTRLFIWLGVVALVIVPLVLVWERPLAPGIKIAVTITISLLVFIAILAYGISWLLSAARMSGSSSSSVSNSVVDD